MYLGYYDCYSGHLNNVATCRSDTSEKCISIGDNYNNYYSIYIICTATS